MKKCARNRLDQYGYGCAYAALSPRRANRSLEVCSARSLAARARIRRSRWHDWARRSAWRVRSGDDLFGKKYLEHLIEEKVNVDCVAVETGETTGVADIWVADSGENSIISISGANAKCDLDWLNAALERLSDCDIFLLQLEIPHETVGAALKKLCEMGKTVILDPAPAVPLPAEWLACADYITPNETELEILTGDLPKNATVEARIRRLVGESNRMVIHKRGAEGAFIGTKDGVLPVSGFKVKAVDTTAAGDTFNAGLAAGLAMGKPIEECVRLANAAGALAVTALGAQGCMPTLEMIRERFGIE